MKTPQISIVMPVYNAEQYLLECIDSVLSQTFIDFEFIIVDDGSTDNSLSIINSYNDARINLILNNHNYIQTLNIGMSEAKGKYVARMDADDIMMPNRLHIQFEFMADNPDVDICGTWMETFGKEQRIMQNATNQDNILLQSILYTPLYHPTVMMKQELIQFFPPENNVYQVYSEDYIYAEDYHCWIQLLKMGCKFANISEPLLKYRLSTNQITYQKQKEMAECTYKIQNGYLEYVMDSIISGEEAYYNILDSSIDLYNREKLSFSDLRQIVYVIYSRILNQMNS